MSGISYEKYLRPEDMTRLMLIATVKKLQTELAAHTAITVSITQAKLAGLLNSDPTIEAGKSPDSL